MSVRRGRRWVSWVAALIALTLTPALALAEGNADRLFAEGLALMEDGRFSEALEKLEQAQAEEPGIGTEFNIALCYEHLGKVGTAHRHYANVVGLAHASGKTQREASARQKLEALRPSLPVFVFEVADADGVTVSLDGAPVPRASWKMVPVDPGAHLLEAEAPGRIKWTLTREAPPPGTDETIEIPALVPVVSPPSVALPPAPEAPISTTRRTVGLVLGGVGVAGLAAATVTGIMLVDLKATADDGCRPTCTHPDGTPNEDAIDAVNRGKALLPVNLVAWGIGLAGLGAGAFLVLTSGRKPAPSRASAGSGWFGSVVSGGVVGGAHF